MDSPDRSLHSLAYLLVEYSKNDFLLLLWSITILIFFSPPDKALISKLPQRGPYVAQARQQGEYESLHRDMMVGFGTWEFDPMDLEKPFPNGKGSMHLWQGDDDLPVPVALQRFIARRLPWIKYHEPPQTGHMFPHADGVCDATVKTLLVGETTASA